MKRTKFKTQSTELSLQKGILTIAEAARFLGISLSHLYKLTSQKKIPHSKPNGKKIYFSRTELEKWMMSNPVTTINDIDRQAENYLINNKIKKF